MVRQCRGRAATIKVPFTGHRPAVLQDRSSAAARLETALVQVFTDIPHPEFGSGALVVTRLPVSPGADQAMRLDITHNEVRPARRRVVVPRQSSRRVAAGMPLELKVDGL